MLPNFVHIGAAKCASTWLWRVYQEHPDIYVPADLDNVNFFVGDYHKGLEWYEKTYFDGWSGERAVGETSNSYMVFEKAVERITRDLPDVKLTMTLRNPIDRSFIAWSHMQTRRFGPEQRMGFERGLDPHGWVLFRYWFEPSLYAAHLKAVFRHCPRERVLICFYDDLLADPARFLRGFFGFLGVDADFRPSVLDTVVGFPSPEWPDNDDRTFERGFSKEFREQLQRFFRSDIEELQEITGRDLSHWG